MADRVQTVAGRFELGPLVASGGFGDVHRARDLATGAAVALKRLRSRHDAEHAQRFAREAEILASVSHPNIVAYVAHGRTPDGELYLAMEWLEGEDLSCRLAGGRRLSVPECMTLAERVAEALATAHALGVVHRDVKPANLFLPAGGGVRAVKVLDFGVAHLRASARPATRSGLVVGTPGYIAPEQARGVRDLDARADVFALGAVLYHCLTGAGPFAAADALASLAKIVLEEVPPCRERGVDLPPALDELVLAMLAKARDARPRDGAEIIARLAAVAAQAGGAPGPAAASPALLDERELVAVVMAGAGAAGVGDAELRALASPQSGIRGRVERLLDGSVIVALSFPGSATDLAVMAARAALALRRLAPDAPLAVATGHALTGGRVPMGEALEGAARLLRTFGADELAATAPATPARPRGHSGAPAPIRLDAVTASLLARAQRIGDAELRRSFLEKVPENERTLALAGAARTAPPGTGPT